MTKTPTQAYLYRDKKMMRLCEIEGCNRKHYGKGCCSKHYMQLRNHGKILSRTMFDPNEFIIENDVCRIKLYDRKGNERAEAIIDTEDYEKARGFKWCIWRNHKVYGYKNGGFVSLHRLVLPPIPKNKEVDHHDSNSLNNRKSNLRICTHQQNMHNYKIPKNNTSGFKGVTWSPKSNQWRVRIQINYQTIRLGLFKNKIAAAKAYNKAAIKYHKEFARLNIIPQV